MKLPTTLPAIVEALRNAAATVEMIAISRKSSSRGYVETIAVSRYAEQPLDLLSRTVPVNLPAPGAATPWRADRRADG